MITNSSTNGGLTRRSFIKRSTVAAVAVSSMTIFSGLVNAGTPTSYGTYTCEKQVALGGACYKKDDGKWYCTSENGAEGTCTQYYSGTQSATMTCTDPDC